MFPSNHGHLKRCYVVILLPLLVLAGCARFEPRPIVPAQTASRLEARTLTDSDFQKFAQTNLLGAFADWPPKAWDFEMLTLAAFYYHPSLDLARAQWAVARGGDKTAAGRLNPVLSAVPGYDFSAVSPANPWIPAVSLDVPIETAGKRGYRMARAQQLSESARLNITATAWLVRANLRSSLLDLGAAKLRAELLTQQLAVQDQIVQSLEQRLQAGAVSRQEASLVRIARDKTRLDGLDAQRLAAEARARVADAIGIPARGLEGIEIAAEMNMPDVPQDLALAEARKTALLGRADVLGALAEYAASESALHLEIAKQYPDIHFSPGYQFDQGDSKFTVGITAELPLLNQNQGPIAEAEAHRVEAAAKFNALQAKLISDIDRALTSYRAATGQLAALESLAALQQQQSEAVAAQIKAGAADPLDLLNARLELGASRLAQLDGRIRLQQAVGALEDAMQHPIGVLKPAIVEQAQRPEVLSEKKP